MPNNRVRRKEKMSRIGVLGIQGAVAEHVEMIRSAGAESVKIIKYSH